MALALAGSAATAQPAARTRNVVLVTLDGVRIQEMFGGMDPVVAADPEGSGIDDPDVIRERYWRDDPESRRMALMPFFWGTLAPHGVVLGDAARGSSVRGRNPLRFSAPGYAEILTGRPRPDVDSNDVRRYPHRTLLEHVQRGLHLGYHEVAVIGSWEGFETLAASQPGLMFGNNGYQEVPVDVATPRMACVASLQHDVLPLWEEGRSDVVSWEIALEYLRARQPRLLWVALDESDNWAHARRYGRLLDYLHSVDRFLGRLWQTLDEIDAYRGTTTLVVTTDHGRGVTAHDWVEHGADVPGSEDTWLAVIGPDTPDVGSLAPAPPASQSDVAATVLRLFGLDPASLDPGAGPPVAAAFGPQP